MTEQTLSIDWPKEWLPQVGKLYRAYDLGFPTGYCFFLVVSLFEVLKDDYTCLVAKILDGEKIQPMLIARLQDGEFEPVNHFSAMRPIEESDQL